MNQVVLVAQSIFRNYTSSSKRVRLGARGVLGTGENKGIEANGTEKEPWVVVRIEGDLLQLKNPTAGDVTKF